MKTVLLLGDSIRMFYCENVAKNLKDDYRVVWPDENCRFSLYTLRGISDWTSLTPVPEEVVLIHWNNGLWDMSRHTEDGEPLTSVEDYVRNLNRIINELKSRYPKALITFATTTCVNPKLGYVRNSDVKKYNQAATALMKEKMIPVDDLYSIMAAHPEYIRPEDLIHETEEGAQALANQVSAFIRDQLRKK